MKSCTNHFLQRWTQRIVGITTEREIKDYITQNRQMIIEHANKTFEHAEFLWKGAIGDNTVKNFHIQNDLIYVTNLTNDAFVTIYKVDLGFTDELNATVRKGLVEEIKRLTEEKEELELQIAIEVEDTYHKADQIEEQIKIMEEQLVNMKKERDFLKQSAKSIQSKSLNTGLELKRFTNMLVNSKEYKDDIQATR